MSRLGITPALPPAGSFIGRPKVQAVFPDWIKLCTCLSAIMHSLKSFSVPSLLFLCKQISDVYMFIHLTGPSDSVKFGLHSAALFMAL